MPTVSVGPRRATIPEFQSISVDARIVPDVEALIKKFKLKITAGYDPGGSHAAGGDHPQGLAVDIVPDTAKGGTWADVNAAAAFAAAHPDIFRFVGYDGRFGTTAWPGHGEGQHLHLSWHGAGTAGDTKPLKSLVASGELPAVPVEFLPGRDPNTTPIGGSPGQQLDEATKIANTVLAGIPGKLVGAIGDAVGQDGLRVLMYVLLVGAGTALAVLGAARATGVGQKLKAAAGVTPAGRAAKLGGLT